VSSTFTAFVRSPVSLAINHANPNIMEDVTITEMGVTTVNTTDSVGDADTVDTTMAKATVGDTDKLLSGSTIQFLFVDKIKEADRDAHVGDKVLALVVILVQICLYIYLIQDARNSIEGDNVNVQITHGMCAMKNYETRSCKAQIEDSLTPVFAGMGVLMCFIMSDIAGACQAIFTGPRSAKFAGVLVLVKNVLAIACAAFLARLGAVSSGKDSLLGCVGVVFIHDLGKKVRSSYQYARTFKQFLLLAVVLFLFISVMIVGSGQMSSGAPSDASTELP